MQVSDQTYMAQLNHEIETLGKKKVISDKETEDLETLIAIRKTLTCSWLLCNNPRETKGRLCSIHQGNKQAITITFSESVENNVGNQKISMENIPQAFTVEQLENLAAKIVGARIEYLNEEKTAAVLIAEKYIDDGNQLALWDEISKLQWDAKYLSTRHGNRVVNKHARHNLCFTDNAQEACYADGKGTIVPFSALPHLQTVRTRIGNDTGAVNLFAEGNFYYDLEKCYIGMHGDRERSIVIAIRLGDPMDLHFAWHEDGKQVSDVKTFNLPPGTMYIMSKEAVGKEWKCKKKCLRHAAGDINLASKKRPRPQAK